MSVPMSDAERLFAASRANVAQNSASAPTLQYQTPGASSGPKAPDQSGFFSADSPYANEKQLAANWVPTNQFKQYEQEIQNQLAAGNLTIDDYKRNTELLKKSRDQQAEVGIDPNLSTKGFGTQKAAFAREGSKLAMDAQNDPNMQAYLAFIQGQAAKTQAALPGIQDFFNQQLGSAQGQLNASNARINQQNAGADQSLQALRALQSGQQVGNVNQLLGQTGLSLTPEVAAIIEQQRVLDMQRAESDITRNSGNLDSQLQARLAARGLSGSSVASRGSADLQGEVLRNLEQARNSAQSNALQRELQMRGLASQERSTDISANLGLLQQLSSNNLGAAGAYNQGSQLASSQSQLLNQLVQQYSPAASLNNQLQLGQAAFNPLNQYATSDYERQLNALRMASGVANNPSIGQTLAGVAGAASGSILGAATGALLGGK